MFFYNSCNINRQETTISDLLYLSDMVVFYAHEANESRTNSKATRYNPDIFVAKIFFIATIGNLRT